MQNRSRLVSRSPRLLILACLLVMAALPATAHGQAANRQTPSPAIPFRLGPDSDFAGNLFLAARDIEVPCSLELRPYLDRSYNSRGARTGYFGKGWTADPIDIHVEKRPDGKLIVVMGDGREDTTSFRRARATGPSGRARAMASGWRPPRKAAITSAGQRRALGVQSPGLPGHEAGPGGQPPTVRRDRNGIAPLSIEGSFGKKLTVQWKSGRIAAIEGPAGLRVEYRYDARGRLAAMLGRAAQNQTYAYDTAGLLARARTPGGLDATFTHQGGLLSGIRRRWHALSYRYRAVEGGTAGDYLQEVYNESGQFLRATEIRGSGFERVLVDGQQNRATLKFDRDGRLVASQGQRARRSTGVTPRRASLRPTTMLWATVPRTATPRKA